MKITFVTSALQGGGAERVIVTLANRFAEQGDEVKILMAAGDESVYSLHPAVVSSSIGAASHGNPLVQLKRLWRLRSYLKKHPDDKIVSFSTSINMYTLLASLGLKNRVIVSERNDPAQCAYKPLRDLVYLFGKAFVFQTKDAKRCFADRIQKRSAVIPNPLRSGLPEPWEGEREKKIAAVGRLEPQKNHMLLLDAFAQFHRRYPDYTLHIFGIGSLEQKLRERASQLNVSEYVVFEGFRRDVLETIRTYRMFVLSSDYEGIPNSLLEAMALGLPCIAADCPIGGCAMCIADGENGLLTPTKDPAALRAAMERIAASYAGKERDGETEELFSAKLSQNAVKVRQTFDEKRIAGMWRSYIDGVSL